MRLYSRVELGKMLEGSSTFILKRAQRWCFNTDMFFFLLQVVKTFRERGIPCDVVWMDIDYMDGFRCFTFSVRTFLPFVSWLCFILFDAKTAVKCYCWILHDVSACTCEVVVYCCKSTTVHSLRLDLGE